MDALDLQLLLGRARGVTAAQLGRVLDQVAPGAPELTGLEALVGRSLEQLDALGFARSASRWLHSPDRARLAADRDWTVRAGIRLVDATSPQYPPQLRDSAAAPAVLYVQGDVAVLAAPQVALVGSREPTPPGRRTALEFAARLARGGLTVTGALEAGIAAVSLEAALATGAAVVAVLGSGLDRVHPRACSTLARAAAGRGALVSEYPRGTPPRRLNLARRGRLISGLCLGTVVIEASRDCGSLQCARHAARARRTVWAVPGSIDNPLSRGCHALIRGGAKLVESAGEILSELRYCDQKQSPARAASDSVPACKPGGGLDKASEILLDAFGFAPCSVDELVGRTGLPSQAVASMLLILELEGVVGPLAGGRYVRL